MDRPHAAAAIRWWVARSSDASFVATPLQPNATPAPTIVTIARWRPSARRTYGSMLATPRPISTSVIVSSSRAWCMWRGGAVSPAPTTPITIAATATYS